MQQDYAIRAKLKVSKVDALKEIIRAWGMNPEQLLTRNALAEGAITKQEDITDQPTGSFRSRIKTADKIGGYGINALAQ